MTGLVSALMQARRAHMASGEAMAHVPASLAEAYAHQDDHARSLMDETRSTLAGYKIGATSPALLSLLALDAPFHGPMPSALVYAAPATLPRGSFFQCLVETEVAFRFVSPIQPGDDDPQTIASAIDAIIPVIEIADSRIAPVARPDARLVVADLANFGALVLGAPFPDWQAINLGSGTVAVYRDDKHVAEGSGAAVMGDPFATLCRFIAELHGRGRGIEAGQIVTTGTWTAPFAVAGRARLRADFGRLGTVALTLV